MNQAVPVAIRPETGKTDAKAAAANPAAKAVAKTRPNRADQEFLPAALEILERPPSPVSTALMLGIGALVICAVTWAYVGRIDVVAVAQGKIQPTGRVKQIQPLETGKVVALNVENGKHVNAGDILVELDNADAGADVSSTQAAVGAYRAEALRRRTAIAAVEAGKLVPVPIIAWPSGSGQNIIPPLARLREERVLGGDLGQLDANIASLSAQKAQKKAERDSLAETIVAQTRLIAILQERVTMRSELVAKEAGTKSSLIDAKETLQAQQTTLASQKGQMNAASAFIDVFDKDIAKARGAFVAENAQKLSDAERQSDDFEQKLVKAQAHSQHMSLTSPISGTVQASSLTTIGQVVTTSEELMRIVPDGGEIEVEAYLPNKDIGFVKVGQEAIIKVESFPFTRYGTITAKVVRIAADAIPEPDANAVEGNAAKANKAGSFSNAGRTQNLVFPITLRLDQTKIVADGVSVTLSAGMAVSAEVQTGKRRILEYLFSPLVEVGSEAMRER